MPNLSNEIVWRKIEATTGGGYMESTVFATWHPERLVELIIDCQ
jgi:hypothetical protein